MYYLGFQIIKEKLMACIISLLGVERASRLIIMFLPAAILVILCT